MWTTRKSMKKIVKIGLGQRFFWQESKKENKEIKDESEYILLGNQVVGMLAQHCWGGQKRKVPENC